MIVQFVKYRTGLSEQEALETISKRAARYEALPGLLQKVYIREQDTGEYGGIYFWKDEEAMKEFRESDLARTIKDAYQVDGDARVELFEVVSVLRAEAPLVPAR